MRYTLGFEQRLEQKQVLTQRMIHSMEILQLPLLQLEAKIYEELEKNPLLELDDDTGNEADFDEQVSGENNLADEFSGEEIGSDDEFVGEYDSERSDKSGLTDSYEMLPTTTSATETETERETEAETTAATTTTLIDADNLPIDGAQENFQIADEFAEIYADTIDEMPTRSQNWLENQSELRDDAVANIQSHPQTLQEYLTDQLSWFELSEPVRVMFDRIVNNLDRNGYFLYEVEQFLGADSEPAERQQFDEAMSIIRKLDPSGIGARDLKECLTSQLNPKSPYYDVLRILIQSHLEDISGNRIPQIVRVTGFSIERVQEAIVELRHLNPRPGADFFGEEAAKITPDVIVEKNDEGLYVVRLSEERLPSLNVNRLRINDQYRSWIKDRSIDKTTREYIKERAGSAQWLLDAIEQRKGTLLRVAQAIVNYQIEFFEQTNHAIKPLKMQQIADVVGVHITTVSRACDDKWMLTPQGVYPFKRFFSGTISASDGGDNISQDVVRIKLQEIIDNEDKKDPLSDEAIVEQLKEAGIQVARRTVVKYRQLLNIPSSRVRKSW
ncbi:MAG: RNA polymerase factor sigma-54 [Planctomycetaceae bacterium]|jgi:RNA polymerase sigma-54 factor|nr:RNA polymerase factor sigma-54 [Planctomycetaceae bacterium]